MVNRYQTLLLKPSKENKMIRWLWSKLVVWGWDYSYDAVDPNDSSQYAPSIVLREDTSIDLDDPIRFKVQAVQGGTLVETSWRDRKTDDIDRKMHIITPDQDLAESIGKIVSMELLRR